MVSRLINLSFLFIVSLSCGLNKSSMSSKGNCPIILTISSKQFSLDDSLILIFRNDDKLPLEVSDFSCMWCTSILLFDSTDNLIPVNKKIKVSSECKNKFLLIASGKSISHAYDYTLATLYDILPNRRYKIRITYKGIIKSGNQHYNCSNIFYESWIQISG